MGKQTPDEMEKVIVCIVEAAEAGQREIYTIAEDARRSRENMEKQVRQLRVEVDKLILQVDILTEQERLSRLKLMEVSKNFDKYNELDIKAAYDAAWQLQVKLSVMMEKERGLLQRRNDLELQLQEMDTMVIRGEKLVERLGMVVNLLKGQAEAFVEQLRETEQKQIFALWILKAQEEERHKIARELHDGPAQTMAGLIMKLEYLERTSFERTEQIPNELAGIRQGIRENLADIRRIIFDLRPPQLDARGLIGCISDYLSEFESRYEINTDLQVMGFNGSNEILEKPLEFTVFRVIQEALNNVARHSKASFVSIKFELADESVNLMIKDNGCGFDVKSLDKNPTLASGYGIAGMRERVGILGGKLTIQSGKDRGTRIVARIPR
ncbi:MAG: sensor histidine kinase [Methylocystaceae bacterium]